MHSTEVLKKVGYKKTHILGWTELPEDTKRIDEYVLASFKRGKKIDLLGRGKKGVTGKENDKVSQKLLCWDKAWINLL